MWREIHHVNVFVLALSVSLQSLIAENAKGPIDIDYKDEVSSFPLSSIDLGAKVLLENVRIPLNHTEYYPKSDGNLCLLDSIPCVTKNDLVIKISGTYVYDYF